MSRVAHLTGQKYFCVVGDSKSVDGTYNRPLITMLEGRTGENWTANLIHATAGWTTANAQSGLAAALAALTTTPEFALVNIGANDANNMPSESAFKTAYASILDQLHTLWASIPILDVDTWRGDSAGAYLANCATLNGWKADVRATRSWVTKAYDEGDWLDTWSLDKVHPDTRIGGYSEMARQWFAALSF